MTGKGIIIIIKLEITGARAVEEYIWGILTSAMDISSISSGFFKETPYILRFSSKTIAYTI